MDSEVNPINDINLQENKPDTFSNVLDSKNNDHIGTSEHACTSPHSTNPPSVSVEELTVRNLNSGKLEIVGASNPGVWQDSDSIFFQEFLDKKQDQSQNQSQNQSQLQNQSQNQSQLQNQSQSQNETIDNSLSSPGGIRTKILSKSGFSEFFVKNTLKGRGVILKGPPRERVGVHTHGQSDSIPIPVSIPNPIPIPIPEPRTIFSPKNDNTSLRQWLNSGNNNVDKSKSLIIFKQILDLVDSSHSRGVALQSLRPSCFKLLPSNQVLYLGLENRDGKKRKYVENFNSFGSWGQFPNRSGSQHDVRSRIGGPRASGHGFENENVEEEWYASPEDVREGWPTLSSNVYSLGVFLFELLGSFESARERTIAMMNLGQRILPPDFLSQNPKEAGYCLWLLHPDPTARPTTRDILKSKLVSGIEEISTDKLLSSIDEDDTQSDLLLYFLSSLQDQKQKHATKLIKDINFIESDLKEIQSRQTNNPTFVTNESNSIKSNLNHLESAYFSVRSTIDASTTGPSDPNNNGPPNFENKPLDRLGIFFNGLCKYARFSKFEVCGNLRNGDFSSSANVICSLGFDRDEDYFATAGVSKKIKVYDFHLLLDDSVDIHYPALEMVNKSKLSCISWNSYIKNYLSSADHDGVVKLWDVGSGQAVSHHIEHERRAWSVDFSKVDPTKLASGSDDCNVKLWSINEKKSTSTIRTIANVCCVQFSPYSAHLLSFGSADYRTYCYDLRNVSGPLCILAGHERAVSYVKFLDSETLVSASTDNTLKLWDLKKTSFGSLSNNGCVLTFKGHTNEKNFVGLSVADGYIACGSETNEVFAYYRSLPMPITSHKFGSMDPVSGKETDHINNQFVSSVCWRQKSDMVVAANSSGCLKLLQMV